MKPNDLFFKSIFILLLLTIISFSNLIAQVCGTSGLDGPQNAVPPVNTYFPLAANASLPAGSKSITLLGVPPNDPNYNLSYGVTPIRSGDLILIIQMQDATADFTNSNLYGSGNATNGPDGLGGTGYLSAGNSGKFEYVVATSDVPLTGGLLEFRGGGAGKGAVNTYTNADFTVTRGQRRFQVVRVPQYSTLVLNANITTPPYNGNVGGLIAFDVAGTMKFNGFFVDASQRGFRGGYGPVANSGNNISTVYADPSTSTRSVGKGEGIAGTPRFMWDGFNQVDNVAEGLPNGSYGRGAPGNAGGAGNDHNAGGGGGGNAGFGGIGGRGWQGGGGNLNPLTGGGRPGSSILLDYSRLIMGGGGGGGDANNATSGVKGGVGGGIILINVEKIDGAGIIRSNGGVGEPGAFGSAPDGAGGGGAGGSIFVRSLSASPAATLTIEARGGNGGNTKNDNGNEHGPGGGGGGGFIFTQVPSAIINSNIQKGLSGRANAGAGISHGATDGVNGSSTSFTTSDLPSHLQGGGSICYPILTTTLNESFPGAAGIRPPGSTATYLLRVTNALGGGNAGGVNVDFQLPFGFSLNNVSVVLSGDAAGPTNPTFTVGASGKITFGTYNISPGDFIEFNILVNISNNIPSGIYHASAQATNLDPTRTNADPLRKITANHQQFTGSNTTYETGGITNVPGFNYNGDLNTSISEDVYINAPPAATDCNAVTNGDFELATVQDYDSPNYLGSWRVLNYLDRVRIVPSISDNTNKVAYIKEGFSLQQTILSIKPSTNYSLNFSYVKDIVCGNTSSVSKIKVEIIDANTLAVLQNISPPNANTSPLTANIPFTTGAGTSSIIIKISDDNSPNQSCAVLVDNFTITSPLDFEIQKTNVSCNGVSDGSFSVVALSGGAAPYTISYSSDNGVNYSTSTNSGIIPQTSGFYTITGLLAGTYKVRILDANGCGDPAKDITINQPEVLVLTGTNTTILCNASTSTVTLNVTGGTAPYRYSINNGASFQTQNTFPNLIAGIHDFLVADANGCTDTYSISFTEPANLTLSTALSTISCFGGTASAILTANGGTGVYEYSVDGISYQASNTFSNLPAGDYVFRIRDANGCIKEDLKTLGEPTVLTLTGTATPILCNGGTSTVTLTVSGGIAPYQYSSDGVTYQAASTFNNLAAGSYNFYVKDVNNCTIPSISININQPTVLTLTQSHTPILCNGGTSTITLTGSGGTAPYQYSIDNGTTFQTSNTFSNLVAGNYNFLIRDANNCTIPAINVTINQPAVLTLTQSHTPITCNAGTSTITLTGSGGTAPYQYSIDNGTTFQTSNTFSNLVAGNYNFLIRDANNCTIPAINVTINQPTVLTLTQSHTPITCNGGTSTITLTGSGGTAPYQYSIDNGTTFQNLNTFSNLAAGNYNFLIRDANNCTVPAITIIINQPAVLTLTQSHTPITCNGGTSTVTLTGSGGTAPYQYSIDNGTTFQNLNTFSNLVAGNYNFLIKDANNCTIPAINVTINQPTVLTLTQSHTPILCNAGTSTLTLTGSGGTAPYQYSIDNGTTFQISNIFSNLVAGNYNFLIRDANNCTVPAITIIINQPAVLTLTQSHTPITCNGGTSTITLTGSGGTAPYQYSIDNGTTFQSSNTFSNLVAGNYNFLIRDANNCTVPAITITINQPNALIISQTHVDLNCNGDNNGSININISGGTAPYSFDWNNGATTLNQANLLAGSYTITVIDANNCQITQTITLVQPQNISISASRFNVKCFGESTGSINITVTGGTAPYSYSWNNAATTEDLSGLIAGSYSLAVTDSKGCLSFATIPITQPSSSISISETHVNNTCFSENQGSIDLTVNGGVGPYLYTWSNGLTSQDINNLAPGNYTVTVRDANNCVATSTIIITPLAPFIISSSQTNLQCNGVSTGEINLNLSGGTLPYLITWNNGATTSSLQNLAAGTYSYTARDNNGCELTNNFTIIEPALLAITGNNSPILCNGDLSTVTLTSTGGTGAYQYSKDGTNFQTSNIFSNLLAGACTFSVKDANNCVKIFSITISEPSLLTITGSNSPILCNGDLSTVTLTSTGGTGAYQYSKDGTTFQTSNVFSNLPAGVYTFSLKDANNCVKTFPITISEPALLTITGTNTPILCNGDLSTITLTSTGGTGAYQYSKDGTNFQASNVFSDLTAGAYTFRVKDANNCVKTFQITISEPAFLNLSGISTPILCNGDLSTVALTSTGGTGAYQYSKDGTNFQASNVFSDLTAGAYTFRVKDANNCVKTFPITITQPALLTISGTNTPILCNGDLSTVTLTLTGGTGAYQYSKDGTTFQSSNIFSNLAAGSYTFTVKDASNCVKTFPITITQPALLTITGTNTPILCNGDLSTVTLKSTGGTGVYQYSKDGTNFQSSNIFSNLPAGAYTFRVKDANDCIKTFPFTISEPALLTITGSNTPILCNGDLSIVTLTSSGGTGAYQYSKDGANFQASNVFSNLPVGAYTFRVKDANDCIKTFPITINQPNALSVTASHQNILCFGQATGSINISVSGGTAPYTYAWNNGAVSKDLNNLIAGTYTLTVSDENQCKFVKSILISQPNAPLNVAETHQNVLCFGQASGSINITLSGGTAPYIYSWNNGVNSEDLSTLIAGNYTVTVTDANNCTVNRTVTIMQPAAAITATEIHQNVNCFGVESGAIDISVNGGTAPYSYAWNNGATTQDISGLPAGNYNVIITDANNCKITVNVVIQQPSAPLSMVENHQDILCFGQATGSININLSGGTSPYTYLWSNGLTTKDLNGIAAGKYSIVVTDANGCKLGKEIIINQPNAPLIITETRENVKCFGDLTGRIDIIVTGGTAPYTYSWNNGGTTQDPTNLPAGTYGVTVTDANGCIANKQIQISQPVAPLTLIEIHVNNKCFGDRIGSISVTVNGGTAPYTFKWNTGQTTQNLTSLGAGVYQLTVTDANGCTQNISATIMPLQAFIVTESMQNVKCFDESTGSINLNLSGGEAPYIVTWSNGATGSRLLNLKAGNYTYTAVDAYGCEIKKTIAISQPPPLAATFRVTNTSCKFTPDGSIVLNVTGGTAPFKYTWNGFDRGPNASLINITSGKYIIVITDANSCSIFLEAEVLPGNCAPNADNDKYTTNEDTPITIGTPGIIMNDGDPDQDEIKIMLNTVRDPSEAQGTVTGNNAVIKTLNGGVVINNSGSFTYTPKKNFVGTERFVYKVSDGSLLSNFATVTIEVLAVNDPPVAVNDNYTTLEDIPFDGTVIPNDSDPDADPLTYSLLGQPNNAVVSFNANGTFRFVPVLNFNGTITFDYQVCDPSGLCDTATVTVLVTPVNDPPVALDDTFKTQINLPFSNRVTDNDSDPDKDPLQYSALTQPANGTLIFNTNGTFIYTPRNGFKGTDTFTYRTCDPSGLCDNATVTILVQPIVTVNLIPSTGTIKEGDKFSITAVLTESIFEDAIVTLAFGGTATNNSDYTLTGNFITITIPAGQTTTTQEFTINAINDALKDNGEQVTANVSATSSVYVLIGTGSVINITDIFPTTVPTTPGENPDINPDPLISPNRDGQGNEKFIIYNISKYPDNEVLIFNRWGNEVFKITGYNNNDKAFEGVANVGILTNTNKDLVDGVYYYIIYTTQNGSKKVNKGYLILKR